MIYPFKYSSSAYIFLIWHTSQLLWYVLCTYLKINMTTGHQSNYNLVSSVDQKLKNSTQLLFDFMIYQFKPVIFHTVCKSPFACSFLEILVHYEKECMSSDDKWIAQGASCIFWSDTLHLITFRVVSIQYSPLQFELVSCMYIRCSNRRI